MTSCIASRLRKVALPRQLGLRPAGQARHVHIKKLELRMVPVPGGATVCAEEVVERLPHLGDVLIRTSVERALHGRLLGAGCAPEGAL